MTMSNIYHMNEKGIIRMGRFNAKSLLKQIRNEEGEDLGFAIRYYTDRNPIGGIVFFSPTKNEIRGLDNLKSSRIVYCNVIRKIKQGKEHWILKISNALKGGE